MRQNGDEVVILVSESYLREVTRNDFGNVLDVVFLDLDTELSHALGLGVAEAQAFEHSFERGVDHEGNLLLIEPAAIGGAIIAEGLS